MSALQELYETAVINTDAYHMWQEHYIILE